MINQNQRLHASRQPLGRNRSEPAALNQILRNHLRLIDIPDHLPRQILEQLFSLRLVVKIRVRIIDIVFAGILTIKNMQHASVLLALLKPRSAVLRDQPLRLKHRIRK